MSRSAILCILIMVVLALTSEKQAVVANVGKRVQAPPSGVIFRVEQCPELCDYPDVQGGRVVYEDHRGPGIEIYGWNLQQDTEFAVVHDEPHQHFPVIHGDLVAYTDLRDSSQGLDSTDVYARNLVTGEEFVVSDAPGQQIRLAIGERAIVWEDDRHGHTGLDNGGARDIYAFDLATRHEIAVATGAAVQVEPDVDQSMVVWAEDRRIRGRDLDGGSAFDISPAGSRSSRPAIHGDLVVWEEYVWDGARWHADLHAYRFSTQEVFALIEAPGDQQFADVSGQLVVWQDDRNGNWEIYAFDLQRETAFAVTQNGRKQKWPAVDENIVVWSDFIELEPHIYGFVYDGEPPAGTEFEIKDNPGWLVVGAFPGGEMRLSWKDRSDVERNFVVERNVGGMLGTGCQVVAVLPAGAESYVDHPMSPNVAYWYRVYAVNGQGRSATTNESYNVALPSAPYPNEQERYMHVLINEVRAEPAAFGYPAYATQPPLVYHESLNYAARAHAVASVLPGGSGGHVDWADRGPGERAVASGYDHSYVSENMATFGGYTAADVELLNRAFLDSHGHRDNILVAGETEVGLGYYYYEAARQGSWVETFAGRQGLTIPHLPAGAVAPFEGGAGTAFTFAVNFYHPAGNAPASAQVVVDGVAYDMALATGAAGNGTYRYTSVLDGGAAHQYYFQFTFAGGSARLPQQGAYGGPRVPGSTEIGSGDARGKAMVVQTGAELPLAALLPVIYGPPPTTCQNW